MNGQEILSQFTSAAVVVYVLQLIKRSTWFPWLTIETKKANRIVAALGAAASALGVHFAFDMQAGSLLITGLTVTGVLHGGWHWLNAMAIQQTLYDGVVAKGELIEGFQVSSLTVPGGLPAPGTTLRAWLLPLVLVTSVGLMAGCAPKNPNLSPQGQAASVADQVVLRVNELESAAIQANSAGALSTETTRLIVKFCVDADKTLKAVPLGWRDTVKAAWAATKHDLGGAANKPDIAAALTAVDTLITALAGDQ